MGGDRNGLPPYVLVLSKGTQAPPTTRPLLPTLGRGPASPAQHFGIGLLSSAVTWVGQPAGEQRFVFAWSLPPPSVLKT